MKPPNHLVYFLLRMIAMASSPPIRAPGAKATYIFLRNTKINMNDKCQQGSIPLINRLHKKAPAHALSLFINPIPHCSQQGGV